MRVDLTGDTYGRLKVIKRADVKNKHHTWLCQCVCGRQTVVAGHHLKHGMTTSCGCFKKEKQTLHGFAGTSGYKCWYAMIDRCENSANDRYKDYGGRGIKVCERWSSVNGLANFLIDMGQPPAGLSLDRIDYCLENCRWATSKQQAQNRRISFKVKIDDKIIALVEACRITNINYSACFKHMSRQKISAQEAFDRYQQKQHGWRV